MCVGGGGAGGGGAASSANIKEPTKREYTDVEKAVNAITDEVAGLLSKDNPLMEAYELLSTSNGALQRTMLGTERLSLKAANHQLLLSQDAARLAALKGPPPPEKAAEAPLIGSQRRPRRSTMETGRSSLRIDRTAPSLQL